MMRPVYAVLGALGLVALWLGLIAYQCSGDVGAGLASLGDAAQRARLPGVAAKCYLQASVQERKRLQGIERTGAPAQALLQRIIAHRIAAARVLLDAGNIDAAERIALEGARADYDDLQARALLLEIRLQGRDPDAARRELMLLVLKNEHPLLLALLGQAFAGLDRPDDAESFYRRALQRDNQHLPALLGMARLARSRRDAGAMAKWLQAATQAAERPDEKRAVTRLQPLPVDPWQRASQTARTFAREHGGSLLFACAYLLFLVSPGLYGLLKPVRGAGEGPRGASEGVAARS